MSGISPYCCCCPPECIDVCPEGYEVELSVPSPYGAHVIGGTNPANCTSGSFSGYVYIYEEGVTQAVINVTMMCEEADGVIVWTLSQMLHHEWGFIDGEMRDPYVATIQIREDCIEDGLPSPGIYDNWDVEWYDIHPKPPDTFPLRVEIRNNPLP